MITPSRIFTGCVTLGPLALALVFGLALNPATRAQSSEIFSSRHFDTPQAR